VGTDAAAEGINLQFCWVLIKLRRALESGPALRNSAWAVFTATGQKRDRVAILNLVAGKTREGRVVKTLLDKMEEIRTALGLTRSLMSSAVCSRGFPSTNTCRGDPLRRRSGARGDPSRRSAHGRAGARDRGARRKHLRQRSAKLRAIFPSCRKRFILKRCAACFRLRAPFISNTPRRRSAWIWWAISIRRSSYALVCAERSTA